MNDKLTVTSELLSEEALLALAHAEWNLQHSLDALFGVTGTVAADFAAFVWLVLQTHAETLHAPGDRLNPMRSLPAMGQADDESVPARWMALAEKVATVYDTPDPASARRWASTGRASARSASWVSRSPWRAVMVLMCCQVALLKADGCGRGGSTRLWRAAGRG